MPIVQTRDLCKVFRSPKRAPGTWGGIRSLFSGEYTEKVAVDGISMTLEAGELVGYIGPNGAGKSTTIKMLTGILTPTSGRIEVAGFIPYERRRANARNIGVVFGQRSQLYWDLPLQESFALLRAIYDVPKDRYRKNIRYFIELLEMGDFLDTPVRKLSLGQRMRGDFAAAMLHDPKIVYLDEPTIGLDMAAKEAVRRFVTEINRERGVTIILTTHDLSDVERLCRRIIVIDNGKLIYDGTIERIKNDYGKLRTLVVELCEPCENFRMDGVEVESHVGNIVRLRFDRNAFGADVLIRRVADAYGVNDVRIEEPDLESIIRRLYVESSAARVSA
jgi:ABC-2 type transport system ATP-binding protein